MEVEQEFPTHIDTFLYGKCLVEHCPNIEKQITDTTDYCSESGCQRMPA